MPDIPPLSLAQRAALAVEHTAVRRCHLCQDRTPCRVLRALATIDAMEAVLRAEREGLMAVVQMFDGRHWANTPRSRLDERIAALDSVLGEDATDG